MDVAQQFVGTSCDVSKPAATALFACEINTIYGEYGFLGPCDTYIITTPSPTLAQTMATIELTSAPTATDPPLTPQPTSAQTAITTPAQTAILTPAPTVNVCQGVADACDADLACSKCTLVHPFSYSLLSPDLYGNAYCCQFNLGIIQQALGTTCDAGEPIANAVFSCFINEYYSSFNYVTPCDTYISSGPTISPTFAPTLAPTSSPTTNTLGKFGLGL